MYNGNRNKAKFEFKDDEGYDYFVTLGVSRELKNKLNNVRGIDLCKPERHKPLESMPSVIERCLLVGTDFYLSPFWGGGEIKAYEAEYGTFTWEGFFPWIERRLKAKTTRMSKDIMI